MRKNTIFQFLVLASCLVLPGCTVELDSQDVTPADLDVQVQFANEYDNIEIRLEGKLDSPMSGTVPSNVPVIEEFDDELVNVFVVPTEVIAFPRQNNLHPGGWSVTTTVANSSGAEVFSFTCSLNVSGGLLGIDSVLSLKFLEEGLQCTSQEGSVEPPALHDIAVTSLEVSPTPVILGGTYLIRIGLANNRSEPENGVLVRVEDTPPGSSTSQTIGVVTANTLQPSGSPGSSSSVVIEWDTSSNTLAGTHRLRAVASISGINETDEQNNEIRQNIVVQQHDAEAVAVTATAASVGDVVPVNVRVRNNGNVADDIQVNLAGQPPGGGAAIPIGSQLATVAAGAEVLVTFDWDTACIGSPGSYTLTANVAVDNDSTPANDSSPPTPLSLAIDHELGLNIVLPTASVSRGSLEFFTYELINNNSTAESGVMLAFQDVTSGQQGTFQFAQSPPFDLACGETRELQFVWGPGSLASPGEVHDLVLTISSAIPGDDPADNSDSVTVTVQN